MSRTSDSTDPNTGVSYSEGMVAFNVRVDCSLDPTPAWQQPGGPGYWISMAPPTVANGVVYYGNGTGDTVHAFDATDGTPLWDSGSTIGDAIFAAPTVANGRLYVGSWDGNLYAFGP